MVMLASCGCQDVGPASSDPPATSPVSAGTIPSASNAAVITDTTQEIPLDNPTSKNPVVLRAAIMPATAMPGDVVTLTIQARTARNWHIYAVDRPTGMAVPTSLNLNLPPSVTAETEWENPVARPYVSDGDICFVYEGDFVFRRKLRIADSATPGAVELACDFTFQACNDAMCLAPKTLPLQATLEIESE